jgi:polyribonucleotide nucleotidyltransferase
VVTLGDTVKVKLLGFDDRGKVKLSMKRVDQQTGADLSEQFDKGGDRGQRAPAAS